MEANKESKQEVTHKGDDPKVTDPQFDEKKGNIFSKLFDKLFARFDVYEPAPKKDDKGGQ
jgi:hypothetical protein